jgi:hypothetical protein
MTPRPAQGAAQVRPRPEGGGGFAPAPGFDGTVAPVARRKPVGRSGANRAAGGPESAGVGLVPGLTRDLGPFAAPAGARPRLGGQGVNMRFVPGLPRDPASCAETAGPRLGGRGGAAQ